MHWWGSKQVDCKGFEAYRSLLYSSLAAVEPLVVGAFVEVVVDRPFGSELEGIVVGHRPRNSIDELGSDRPCWAGIAN
jgi:hypothetical protein